MIRRIQILTLLLFCLSGPVPAEPGEQALYEAVRQQDTALVKSLLEQGADPNWVNTERMASTALMMAAARNDTNTAEILLDAGAAIDVVDENGDPAINWAAYYGYKEMVALLLDRGASTALVGHGATQDIVMRRGHQELVLMLARHNGTAPELDAVTAEMQAAIDSGDFAALQTALQKGASPSALDETGRPMLARAARLDRTWLVNLLLESGAKVDAEDSIGYTALMEASREGNTETLELLLAKGADPEHQAKPRGMSFRPMHLAAVGGDQDVLAILIATGADLDAPDSMQAPPALWALFENQTQACLELLRAGADFQHVSDAGYSVASAAEEMQVSDVTEWISRQAQ